MESAAVVRVLDPATAVASLASQIVAEHDAAQTAKDNAVGHAIRAGELLLRVKVQLPHGAFLPWIAAHMPFGKSTAYGYMAVAKRLANPNFRRAGNLSIRQVLSITKGGDVELPKAAALAKAEPEPATATPVDVVRSLVAQNKKVTEIATTCGHSERWVYNVMRREGIAYEHVTQFPRNTPQEQIATAIRELLAKGNNLEQIAAAVGRDIETVREIMTRYGIARPQRRGRTRVSPHKVISELVNAVTGAAHGMRLIDPSQTMDITPQDAAAMLAELRDAMKALAQAQRILTEIAK